MLNTYTKKPRMVKAVIYLHLLSEKYISIYFHGVLLPTEAYMTTPRSMVRRSLAQPIGIPLRSQAASRSCHIWEEDESKGWIWTHTNTIWWEATATEIALTMYHYLQKGGGTCSSYHLDLSKVPTLLSVNLSLKEGSHPPKERKRKKAVKSFTSWNCCDWTESISVSWSSTNPFPPGVMWIWPILVSGCPSQASLGRPTHTLQR